MKGKISKNWRESFRKRGDDGAEPQKKTSREP